MRKHRSHWATWKRQSETLARSIFKKAFLHLTKPTEVSLCVMFGSIYHFFAYLSYFSWQKFFGFWILGQEHSGVFAVWAVIRRPWFNRQYHCFISHFLVAYCCPSQHDTAVCWLNIAPSAMIKARTEATAFAILQKKIALFKCWFHFFLTTLLCVQVCSWVCLHVFIWVCVCLPRQANKLADK